MLFTKPCCQILRHCLESGDDRTFHTADHFELTDEERKRLLPSGAQGVFMNRVAWAKTHLRMAGLIEPTARGVFKITQRGLDLLRMTRDCIDLRLLQKQPGYLEARGRKREKLPSNGFLEGIG